MAELTGPARLQSWIPKPDPPITSSLAPKLSTPAHASILSPREGATDSSQSPVLQNSLEDHCFRRESASAELPNLRTQGDASQDQTSREDVRIRVGDTAEDYANVSWADSSSQSAVTDLEDGEASKRRIKGVQKHVDDFLTDTWFREISNWLFSAGCLLAIVLILFLHDNQPLPDWPYNVTLNTLLTLFVTLATASIMVPVSHGISQLKWNWFQNGDRVAADLDVFDQASRGPWGSIRLLLSLQYQTVSSLGAIITVLVLAANAVTQQTITYAPKTLHEFRNGSLIPPRATYIGPPEQLSIRNESPVNVEIDLRTEGAVNTGLLAGNAALPPLDLHCPTGNCTWPEYKTLGVCASFANLTDRLSITCANIQGKFCTGQLPGVGLALFSKGKHDFETFNIRSTGVRYYKDSVREKEGSKNVTSAAFEDISSNTLADFYVLWNANAPDNSEKGFQAFEINLHYCVQTLQSSVVNGKSMTTIAKSPTEFSSMADVNTDGQNRVNFTDSPGLSHEASRNLTTVVSATGEKFDINMLTVVTLDYYMKSQFNGQWKWDSRVGSFFHTTAIKAIVNAIAQPPYNARGLRLLANNVAMSLTNHIRSTGFAESDVPGHVLRDETYVHINWWWITLLVTLEVVSLGFLVCVIVLNRRTGCQLWRSSNIALVQVLEPDTKLLPTLGLRSCAEVQEKAKTVRFNLRDDETGWKLSVVR